MRVSVLFDCFVDTLVDFETRRIRMKIIIFRDSRYKIWRQVRRKQYFDMYLLNFNKNNTFIVILFLMFFNYYYCYWVAHSKSILSGQA